MELVLFILLGAALAGGAYYVQQSLRAKRRAEFARAGAALGLRYSATDDERLVALPFDLFREGDGRGVENVLAGEHGGCPVRLFDYWYYERSTDSKGRTSKTYHRFSCALTHFGAGCPRLVVRPEGLLSRLADAVGFRDVELESEEFNRAFEVKSDDPKLPFAVLDQRLAEWLLASRNGCRYELVGNRLLCSTDRRSPGELPWLLDQAEQFVGRMPDVVASLYPPPGPGGP